jgi:protein-S-isoprenylcysteine O-methyltransferase Ste14
VDPFADPKMAKNALRVGKPVDFSAEVPVYPPFALLAAFAASLLMWRLTGKRLRWLSWPIDSKWVRVAAFVGAVSVLVSVVDAATRALRDAGSSINFTDVEGLATAFPFDATRNPVYACLLFVFTPALAVLIDSAWPLVFLPLLYAYISDIVIPAEENQLLAAFGKKYAEYAAATPRLSAMGLARTPPSL